MHRLARRAALPLGAAAVLPTSRPRAEDRAPAVQRRLTAVADLAIEAQLFQPAVPWPQWDCNWDHRELDSRGRRRSLLKPSGAPRRHLILIRHGQYDESASDDSGRVLTALGKRQAVAAGKRVAELLSQKGAVCRGVHSSRLARAVETADLIHAQLNNVPRLPGGARRPSSRSRPNSLKIEKETTHDLVWWTRRASTVARRRATVSC